MCPFEALKAWSLQKAYFEAGFSEKGVYEKAAKKVSKAGGGHPTSGRLHRQAEQALDLTGPDPAMVHFALTIRILARSVSREVFGPNLDPNRTRMSSHDLIEGRLDPTGIRA